MAPMAQAENPCMEYNYPGSLDLVGDLEAVKKDLSDKIAEVARHLCGPTTDLETSIKPLGPLSFLFSYSFKYAGLEENKYSEYAIYDKKDGKWILRLSLNELEGDGIDLNGDGIPERVEVSYNNFRTQVEEGKKILALDANDYKYKTITGLETFYMAELGVCRDETYNTEDLAIDKSAKNFPIVTLSRKNIKRTEKGCDESVILTENWQYQWDPANKRYINRGYSNSLNETVSFKLEEASGKIALLYDKKGDRKKLDSTFSKDSALFAFFRSSGYLFFKAEDKKWLSEYAWDVEKNELYFRAMNKMNGKKYYSKGKTKAVFEKIPWMISKF